jgi:hypothetical protein
MGTEAERTARGAVGSRTRERTRRRDDRGRVGLAKRAWEPPVVLVYRVFEIS